MKRDLKLSMKRDLFPPALRGVGLFVCVHETYIYGKRPIKEKETCIDEKRSIKETYFRLLCAVSIV